MIRPRIELRVGQVWTPAAGTRARPRAITFLGPAPGRAYIPGDAVGFLAVGYDGARFTDGAVEWTSWLSAEAFRVWIKKRGATCTEPVTDAEVWRV